VASDAHELGRYATDLVHPGRPELSEVASTAVRELGLEDDLDTLPESLPHGRRRLVAIARAVAASPRVLLLDEPAAGLSGSEGDELGAIVRRLAHEAGLAVLLIEHDVGLVMTTCDRIAVLDFGRLIALGPPAEIAADEAVVAAYLGTPA
jgi:sulfate-transporting ATPase